MNLKAVVVLALLCVGAAPCAAAPGFDEFWRQTLAELKTIAPSPTMRLAGNKSSGKAECFKVDYRSLGQRRVYAWYCRPKRTGRSPGIVINPWYGLGQVEAPLYIAEMGYAVLAYQGRGYEVDLSSYPPDNSSYMTLGITDPKGYVYREMVAHALRSLDFLASRPEVDQARSGMIGPSQGGGLTLIAAALDPRVKAAAADFPFLTGIPEALPVATYPYQEVRDYLAKDPGQQAVVAATLAYFDTANFAARITVPVFITAGLKDNVC
ncbi:MAG: acetylxylan esterase, partial [Elusimicrobiota bacterium]